MKLEKLLIKLNSHLSPEYTIDLNRRHGGKTLISQHSITYKRNEQFSKFPKLKNALRNFFVDPKPIVWIEKPLYDDYENVEKLIFYCEQDEVSNHQKVLEEQITDFKKEISNKGVDLSFSFLPNYKETLELEANKEGLTNNYFDITKGFDTYGLYFVDSHCLTKHENGKIDDVVGVFLNETDFGEFQEGSYSSLDYSGEANILLIDESYAENIKRILVNMEKQGYKGKILLPEQVSSTSLYEQKLINHRNLLKKLAVPGLILPKKPCLLF